ncbi:hypothetical protein TRICHSKD4_3489 [Roseibium sp. TrichSKD4]|uniref:hypothetical protein n=1 Tax=Roseibium sp. TrichSKD4 TaxID=744980 RepID=UPI0001E56835|nr:hypothetical protein [Roseibium sp. TrichSKD4]EFO31260.1 hypothetical protein TRICHSKD4_3489 [Roseibium sp. TrichSKD4]
MSNSFNDVVNLALEASKLKDHWGQNKICSRRHAKGERIVNIMPPAEFFQATVTS